MSALPPKADIGTQSWNVRFVPKADSCTAANRVGSTGQIWPRGCSLRWTERFSRHRLSHGPKLDRIWVFHFPSFRVITYSDSYVPITVSSFVNLLYSTAQWTLL